MNVTMTPFIDFCSAEWGTKVSVIKAAKNRFGQEYDPAADYWKRMRDGFVETLRTGGTASDLQQMLASVRDPKKLVNYRASVAGAKKWMRTTKPVWISSPKPVEWTSGSLTVRVNPELAVELRSRRHVIKLYLRAGSQLTKRRVDSTLHLLELTHGTEGTTVGILDVRRSRLITPTRLIPGMDALLAGEAAAFQQMWELL